MTTVKEGLIQWKNELISQKENAEKRLADAKLNFELAQVKYSIANSAQQSISHNKERQEEFFNKYVKGYKESYEGFVESYDENRKNIYQELRNLDVLINRIDEAMKDI